PRRVAQQPGGAAARAAEQPHQRAAAAVRAIGGAAPPNPRGAPRAPGGLPRRRRREGRAHLRPPHAPRPQRPHRAAGSGRLERAAQDVRLALGYPVRFNAVVPPRARTTFATIRSPPRVMIDSGWNWTAATGRATCSTAIGTPSSVEAVTR